MMSYTRVRGKSYVYFRGNGTKLMNSGEAVRADYRLSSITSTALMQA